MAVKDRLIELFEQNKGDYLSGEDIAARLGVSRAAVWKAVGALREQGYAIDAAPNRGYRLSAQTDILSAQGIEKYLRPGLVRLVVLPSASSTNSLAREKAEAGAPEGLVILANEQTGGRGRRGRSFFSPPGTGIYMSMVLRPRDFSAQQAVRMTTMAAVALCGAIEAVSGQSAGIKWINDVFVRGKKVCGILTEASFGMESGLIEYAVLGMGINVYRPEKGFPQQIADVAGAVFDSPVSDAKNRLAAQMIERFLSCYRGGTDYREEYRKRNLAIGKRVRVLLPGGERSALALDTDDECRLIVQYDDGEREALSSGEISIRL